MELELTLELLDRKIGKLEHKHDKIEQAFQYHESMTNDLSIELIALKAQLNPLRMEREAIFACKLTPLSKDEWKMRLEEVRQKQSTEALAALKLKLINDAEPQA